MPMPSALSRAGVVLTRVIVPLWILAGALFKLYERDPANLPVVIRENARRLLHLDNLGPLLRTLIGLELFAALVIVLIPRVSRAMAIFMLSCFCAILLGEIAKKAQNCGCFGSLPMKPWQMLLIDGSMLVGVIALPRRRGPVAGETSRFAPALTMIPLLIAGLAISFSIPERPAKAQTPVVFSNPPPVTTTQPGHPISGQPTTASRDTQPITPPASGPQPPPATAAAMADSTINPSPMPIPARWNPPFDVSAAWEGKSWREIELFQLMPRWPKDLDQGRHYVVFYRRTCDHCQLMFQLDLFHPLDSPVTAVEIPEKADLMTAPDAWPMPGMAPMEMLQLPLGCSYTITTPLSLRIENGKITCAQEGDHKKCLGLE